MLYWRACSSLRENVSNLDPRGCIRPDLRSFQAHVVFSAIHRCLSWRRYSLIYGLKLCSPFRLSLLALGDWSQQQAALCHGAMWCGLGDHIFIMRCQLGWRMMSLFLSWNVRWRYLANSGQEGNQKVAEMWEKWAAWLQSSFINKDISCDASTENCLSHWCYCGDRSDLLVSLRLIMRFPLTHWCCSSPRNVIMVILCYESVKTVFYCYLKYNCGLDCAIAYVCICSEGSKCHCTCLCYSCVLYMQIPVYETQADLVVKLRLMSLSLVSCLVLIIIKIIKVLSNDQPVWKLKERSLAFTIMSCWGNTLRLAL